MTEEETDQIKLWHDRWLLKCPGCGVRAEIDDDQLHGRVSVLCTTAGCKYHETKNWKEVWEKRHKPG